MKTCAFCKKPRSSSEVCCREYAEVLMLKLLGKSLKKPPRSFFNKLEKIIENEQGKELARKAQDKKEEAFSFSEVIDKFLIIVVKESYLTGEKKKQNKVDFAVLEKIVGEHFRAYVVSNARKLVASCVALWVVNAEIFCINDICAGTSDDRIVAAAARRMIDKIKERNTIKREISGQLHESIHEIKQFQSN